MSQMGAYGLTTKYPSGVTLDEFGYLLLTTAVAQNFKVGEIITGTTSGVTAKVSGIADPGTNKILRVKAVKVKAATDTLQFFTDAETVTGAVSTTTATTGTACFTYAKKKNRQDIQQTTLTTTTGAFVASSKTITRGAGSWATDGVFVGATLLISGTASNNGIFTVKTITSATALTVNETLVDEGANASAVIKTLAKSFNFDQITVTDAGISIAHRNTGGTVTRPWRGKEVRYSMRMGASKTQGGATDTTVTPTTAWIMPQAGSYSVAAATLLRFQLTSNELLTVTGTPRVAIADVGNRGLTNGNLTFVGTTTKTITRVTGSWITDGVYVGSKIAITSSVSNNATFTVTVVDPGGKIVTVSEAVTAEGPVAATATVQGQTVYANYNPAASGVDQDGTMIVSFDYITAAPVSVTVAGAQIASATYGANGGTIVDKNGNAATITPASMGSVTGILLTV